jgi:hypothetical protein
MTDAAPSSFSNLVNNPSLSTLGSAFTSMQGALSQYIVTPLSAFGIGGFVFDVDGAQTANLDADITDHYAEDNSFFQDNIAIHPRKYILRGYVGEVVDIEGKSNNGVLQTVVQKLTQVTALLPTLAAGCAQAQNLISSTDFGSFGSVANTLTSNSFLSSASSLYAGIKNLLPKTKQAAAYAYFKAAWQSKILVSMQTPFEFINNMAIQNVVAIQQEGNKYQMDFAVTLKEIRFAATTTTTFNPNSPGGPLTNANGGTAASNPEIPGANAQPLPSPIAQQDPNANNISSQPAVNNGSVQGTDMGTPYNENDFSGLNSQGQVINPGAPQSLTQQIENVSKYDKGN